MSDRPLFPCAVILAAGGSRRMGVPKGLLDLDGAPLILHQIRAVSSYASKIYVVLGAHREMYAKHLPKTVEVLTNHEWQTTTQAHSLAIAAGVMQPHQTAWLIPVDTAPPRAITYQNLLHSPRSAVPICPDGRTGHPALLGQNVLDQIRHSVPVGGVRTLLQHAARVPTPDPFACLNFNRPNDWEHYLANRGNVSR